MEKIIKDITNNRFIKFVFLPLFLIGVWFFLTAWYISTVQNILILTYPHSKNNFTHISYEKLIKGKNISGQFVAEENNLGIIALRFQKFERVAYKDEDLLLFRIREKGNTNWYYQNYYRSGFIYDMPFLPFGFPIISDSKEKVYEFELESLKGNNYNGVALSSRKPILVSEYQANKAELLKSPQALIQFFIKKFINAMQTIDVLYSCLVFSLPFFFYLFWISPVKKYLVSKISMFFKTIFRLAGKKILGKYYNTFVSDVEKIINNNLILLLLLIVFIDVIYLQVLNNLLYPVIIFLWFILIRAYGLTSKSSFFAGLLFLIISPLYLQFNNLIIAEKAAGWAFMFFVSGLIQALFESPNP